MRAFVLGSLVGTVSGSDNLIIKHEEAGPSSLLAMVEQELSAKQQLPIGHPLLKNSGSCYITFYEHAGWEGWSAKVGPGTYTVYGKQNDAISSFKIPKGCWVFACKNLGCEDSTGKKGSSDFIQDVPSLKYLNDEITTFVVKSYDYENSPRVMLYRDCDISGTAGWFAPPGEYKNELIGKLDDDALSAIQVLPRSAVSLFRDIYFEGDKFDLGPTTWLESGGHCSTSGLFKNDVISSLKIFDCSDSNHAGFERPYLQWGLGQSGTGGSVVSASWKFGYTEGDIVSKSSTMTFTTQLTHAVEAGADLAVISGKSSLSVSLSASAAFQLSEAASWSQSLEFTCEFMCPAELCNSSSSVYIWFFEGQFKRNNDAFPVIGGEPTKVASCHARCSCSNVMPQCLPDRCADRDCQECSSEPQMTTQGKLRQRTESEPLAV